MNPYEPYRELIKDYIDREIEVLIALQQLVDQELQQKEAEEVT